jgi:Asp-tRNA(Asn)/Glu-tRNA(Gln) amidotransferase A subunit family amidase
MTAPHELTASEATAAMREGRLTSVGLVRACLDRIVAREPEIQAWTALDPERALAEARTADEAPSLRPLHGVPVGIKDVIETADLPTSYGSPLYAGAHPSLDARCVTLLRAGGAIVLGKTETVEFAAAGRIPPTRNPHDFCRTPGGSSSGSAAAVADGMVPVALGTQTGGSTIRPASFTGLFALKPTFGATPVDGVRHYAPSLDTVSWFARSVADLDRVADAFELPSNPDGLGTLRIGVFRGPHWEEASNDARDLLDGAVKRLAGAGVSSCPIAFDEFDALTTAQETIMYGEGAASFRPEARRFRDRLHPLLREIADNVRGIGPEAMRNAYDLAARGRVAFEMRLRETCDAVLTLAAPGEAPDASVGTGDARFNKMWSALGAPCLAIPFGSGRNGLPIGLQLVGVRFSDRRLLAIGQVVSKRLGLRCPVPPAVQKGCLL